MNVKIRKSVSGILGAFCALAASSAIAGPDYFLLPTPENDPLYATYQTRTDALGVQRDAIVINNIAVAFRYDDFWSYSAPLLEAIQTVTPQYLPTATFGAYNFTTGTGTIDVNLTSVAGGATNVVTLSNGTTIQMQDPVNLASNQGTVGWTATWGGTTQTFAAQTSTGADGGGSYTSPAAAQGGTTTVGNLLTYLKDLNPTWSVPVLYADYNQTGSGDSLWFSAKVEIIDPATGLPVASWQLDRTTNNTWDQTDPTFNFGKISFLGDPLACAADPYNPATGQGCAGVTGDGADYLNLEHNKGSGHADFMVYAPDMDLSKYNSNFLFVVTADLGCLHNPDGSVLTAPFPGTDSVGCNTNGGEEFGIFGGVGARVVSEPGSLGLLGVAMALLGWRSRRQQKK